MARDNENDVTDGATERESVATRRARQRALGENPFSSEQMADAIAKAHFRVRDAEAREKEKPMAEIVRASVRCGHETVRQVTSDGGVRLVTMPKKHTFKPHETADGKEAVVEHGRPVRLKRDAFVRYLGEGIVVAG